MLEQKVDLLGRLHRTRQSYLTLQLFAGSLFVVVAVYGAAAWVGLDEVKTLDAETVSVRTMNERLEQALSERKSDGWIAKKRQVHAQIASLQRERAMKEKILGLVREPQHNNRNFSAILLGLARQHQPGIALERIVVSGRGESVAVSGTVSSPELVPTYLYDLGNEAAFSGLNFARMEMQIDETSNLRFEASSSLEVPGSEVGQRVGDPGQLADKLLGQPAQTTTPPPAPQI